ncbi:L-seryl-tRNA(Sec) selenium transferase [Clostridium collagenovorans DSM 3089]|uniref:L-seryl-tRNA(Sec) selenium transferase n=1 Tax=Clostridium collagenovorans DSM 3089 TaxID=1121306 RepID=A0A1M5XRC7_9CLOT|nr:L-seryl-tRNA(Sec) selenium transferase [Clostridium collagenovorans]SHI02309.1 L-seryl-tRNA(Sec) selenium transferase [Clostridium collagenovorans DSM 3089]
MNKNLLKSLPKMDELLENDKIKKVIESSMRVLVIESLREAIDYYRTGILKDKITELNNEEIVDYALEILEKKKQNKLRRVINATGTVIHTNLGRSILSKQALEAVENVAVNYNNLEYDVEAGKRGSRYSHIEELLVKITGAEAGLVVNNNAAAVMLILNTLCKDKEAIVSRGQLVEIGGSFRIPDVMAFSSAKLIEVGTTNRTHDYDYTRNINENTGVLLKVHTSNFKIMGFTEEVDLETLVKMGKEHNIPVVEDIGSGVLVDFNKYGFIPEPTVQESIKKGVDVVSFSGDKMLGGPQAGIIVGKKEYIDRMKKNQITRALRIDKMTLAALEATLKLYLDEKEAIENIPTLNMILSDKETLKQKAFRLKRKLSSKTTEFSYKVETEYSMVGGGSMPTETIEGYAVKFTCDKMTPQQIEIALRNNKTPIVVRVNNGEVILDVRTLKVEEFDIILDALVNIEKKLK